MKASEISFSGESLIDLIKTAFAKNSSFRFRVTGFSMSPFIEDNDIVTISPPRARKIGPGEAAAFVNPCNGKLVIHRVLQRHKGRYFIKGDGVPGPDGWVTAENILGCVTRIERNGANVRLGLGRERRLIAFLNQKGFLPFIFRCWRLIPFKSRKVLKTLMGAGGSK